MNVRNHIHLTGNLGADPKTVILKTGQAATEFSLATNEYYTKSSAARPKKPTADIGEVIEAVEALEA